jgi:hypothetical protein
MIILKVLFIIILSWGGLQLLFLIIRATRGTYDILKGNDVESIKSPDLTVKIVSLISYLCLMTFIVYFIFF